MIPFPSSSLFKSMDDPQTRIKQQLVTAGQLFAAVKYSQCRKVLSEVKMAHPSIELNQLIAETKDSPAKIVATTKKIIDALVALTPNVTGKISRIGHQLHFWNAVVMTQQIGQTDLAQLLTEQAVKFADSMRTETSLMLLYQLITAKQKAGRMASCLSLITKVEQLAERPKQLNETQQVYRFLTQVARTRVLLKLGLVEPAKIAFMMRFNQAPESKDELQLSQINGIPIAIHQLLLHAEIEYHSGSLPQAIKILSEIMPQLDSLGRNKDFVKAIVDHNMAIVLTQYKKSAGAQLLIRKSLNYFSNTQQSVGNNQRYSNIAKCKQNMILAGLLGESPALGSTYECMKECGSSSSFKNSYRKAEICIKYYHQLLTQQPKILLNKEIHDSYQPVYYYPNQPYFQQKGKNKNPNFTNGRAFYRRNVMPEWENQINERPTIQTRDNQIQVKQQKDKKKDKSGGRNGKLVKKEEDSSVKEPPNQVIDAFKAKITQVLASAETHLKQALTFLENQRNVIVKLNGQSKQFSQQVNEKLHGEYVDYKSSIYSLLTYVQLCQRDWTRALLSADAYLDFARLHQLDSRSPSHQQTLFTVLTYRIEVLCQLGRMPNAYEAMQEAAGVTEFAEKAQVHARSTGNQQQGQTYFQKMSQFGNFYYNLAVLHSRDNKIPEAFQAIQKVMQNLRVVPSSPQARMPLSALELLIHYNLRTGNTSSALQLIKRRRILTLPGGIAQQPPTLSITK